MEPSLSGLKTGHYYAIAVSFAIASILFTAMAYQDIPQRAATQWGFGNRVSYSDKSTYIWLAAMPLALVFLLWLLPKADPLLKMPENASNIEKYGQVSALMAGFLMLVNILAISYNIGAIGNFTKPLALGLCSLFTFLGFILHDVKPSWFMGIRTPWSLSSPAIWWLVHDVGGKALVAISLIGIAISAFDANYGILFAVSAMIGWAIIVTLFSYYLWATKYAQDPESKMAYYDARYGAGLPEVHASYLEKHKREKQDKKKKKR